MVGGKFGGAEMSIPAFLFPPCFSRVHERCLGGSCRWFARRTCRWDSWCAESQWDSAPPLVQGQQWLHTVSLSSSSTLHRRSLFITYPPVCVCPVWMYGRSSPGRGVSASCARTSARPSVCGDYFSCLTQIAYGEPRSCSAWLCTVLIFVNDMTACMLVRWEYLWRWRLAHVLLGCLVKLCDPGVAWGAMTQATCPAGLSTCFHTGWVWKTLLFLPWVSSVLWICDVLGGDSWCLWAPWNLIQDSWSALPLRFYRHGFSKHNFSHFMPVSFHFFQWLTSVPVQLSSLIQWYIVLPWQTRHFAYSSPFDRWFTSQIHIL